MSAELQTVDIKSLTGRNIMGLGEKPISEIRKLSNKISKEIDNHSDKANMIAKLNNILESIDCEELMVINEQQQNNSFFKKILTFGKNKTKQVLDKYTTVTDKLNKMYVEVESYSIELENDNETFKEIKRRIVDVQSELMQIIEDSKVIIEKNQHNVEDRLEEEKIGFLKQKVQDLEYTLGITYKMQEDIKRAMTRNYFLYRKVNHLYNTTLPSIQHHINNFRIYQEHNATNELLKYMDDKKNELMQLGTEKSIELEKEMYQDMIGKDEENFKVLQRSLLRLKESNEELEELQQKYVNSLLNNDYNVLIENKIDSNKLLIGGV